MKRALMSAVIAGSVLVGAAHGYADPTPPGEPLGTEATPRSQSDIQDDLKAAATALKEAMPPREKMADPAVRAKAAPAVIPAIKKMIAALDEAMPGLFPGQRAQFVVLKYHLLGTLSLFGDAEAQKTLEAAAASNDQGKSETAKLALLSADWFRKADDAAAQAKILDAVESILKADPASNDAASSAYAMSEAGAATPELKDRAKTLALNVSTSAFTKQLAAKATLAGLENKPLVIEGHSLDGKSFSSSQYAGKVILVDFWATWCGPCKAELPRIKKIYAENHDKGLEIIGVSLDQDADALKSFLKADPDMSWVELFEPGQQINPLAEKYGVQSIPRMLLIDRHGVCRTVEGRQKLEEMLPTLLAEPAGK